VSADIKFCGLTRAEDARVGAELGARYLGAIFADGPRRVTPERAADVLAAPRNVFRVGVFGQATPEEIAATAVAARLDVVQLHADPTAADVDALRSSWPGRIWAVVRIAGPLPPATEALFELADAVLLDARIAGRLGGTGVPLPWAEVAREVDAIRKGGALVLAGGLTPDNVGEAIAALAPDVVDVSSGVETAPGVKDHTRMRLFAEAVRRGGIRGGIRR
jgi:phosphoribosylanthranilate isomerase